VRFDSGGGRSRGPRVLPLDQSSGSKVDEWTTYTPEGRRLLVRRRSGRWAAQCGDGPEAESELLDDALIEAIHRDYDVIGHMAGIDYGKWTREIAKAIERDYTAER
jgi:hypothetical protein